MKRGSPAEERTLVHVLKALAHETRYRMVREIARAGELSCTRVAERFQLAQPTISHHLKILRQAGLLRVRQDGQTHYFSIDAARLDDARAAMHLPTKKVVTR